MASAAAATPPSFSGSSSALNGNSSSSITVSSAAAYILIAAAVITLASRLHALVGSKKRRKLSSLQTVRAAPSKFEVRDGRSEDDQDDDDGVSRDKSEMMRSLRTSRLPDGSHLPADHPSVSAPLERLFESYKSSGVDARHSSRHPLDGDFLMEHSPSFIGKLGHNPEGDPLFTMGRMTFSMIRPTDAVCSLQRVTQHVHRLGPREALPEKIPPKLRDAVEARVGELRTFITKMYFTVENDDDIDNNTDSSAIQSDSDSDYGEEKKEEEEPSRERRRARSQGLRGIMRMDGYCFPHPSEPNRLSVWFTGGLCSPQHGEDLSSWRKMFGQSKMPPRPLSERLTLFAAKAFMGAVPLEGFDPHDGYSVGFELRRPVAAHQDVAYLDDDLRVTVGSKGTVVICSRLRREDRPRAERMSSMVWT